MTQFMFKAASCVLGSAMAVLACATASACEFDGMGGPGHGGFGAWAGVMAQRHRAQAASEEASAQSGKPRDSTSAVGNAADARDQRGADSKDSLARTRKAAAPAR